MEKSSRADQPNNSSLQASNFNDQNEQAHDYFGPVSSDHMHFSPGSPDSPAQSINNIQRIHNTKARQQVFRQIAQNNGNRHATKIARAYHNTKTTVNAAATQNQSVIMRWDSFEHVALGEHSGGAATQLITLECHKRDFPERTGLMSKWPKPWQKRYTGGTPEQKRVLTEGLSYGEVLALSGDFYPSFETLNQASLVEIYDLIPLIRGKTASTTELDSATGGRYLTLAKQNVSHFSNVAPGRRNIDKWRHNHMQAIEAAKQGNANLAWAMNATGDHFLTDAFSGGHIRTPRDKLMGSSTGNIESKILHDRDNENGVRVTNQRGDAPWIAYGDDSFDKPDNKRNKQLAEEAVRLSKQDIADALAQLDAYPTPKASTVFEAEKLVPHPVKEDQSRSTVGKVGHGIYEFGSHAYRIGGLIGSEGPGMAFGSYGDTMAREWVARQSGAALAAVPTTEKIRLINRMLEGWISDDDVEGVLSICRNVPTTEEMHIIKRRTASHVNDMNTDKQRTKVQKALNRQN